MGVVGGQIIAMVTVPRIVFLGNERVSTMIQYMIQMRLMSDVKDTYIPRRHGGIDDILGVYPMEIEV